MSQTFEHLYLLSPAQLLALMKTLRESRRIVVTAHRSPDGDALGSTLAWAAYLRTLGKEATVVLPNPAPDFLQWLPEANTIVYYERHPQRAQRALDEADLLCCLDFNSLRRLQTMAAPAERCKAPRLLIDHHLDPASAEFNMQISHPELSSTCEIVFRLLLQMGYYEEMTPQVASCLYCGLMTDTGNFAYSSSRPEVYEMIGLLLRRGIDKDRIYRQVFHTFSPWRLKLQGYVLHEKVQWLAEGRAALYTLSRQEMKDFHFVRGDAEGLVNMPLQVKGARLSISLTEDTERDVVRVSLRSVGNFPCNEMAAEFFFGGGHPNASGGELPFPLSSAVETVHRAIAAYKERL